MIVYNTFTRTAAAADGGNDTDKKNSEYINLFLNQYNTSDCLMIG